MKFRRKSFILSGLYDIFKSYMKGVSKYNARINPPFFCSNPDHVFIDENVSIGRNASFICGLAKIYIKHHSYSGPNLTIVTGGHMMQVGKFSIDITSEDKIRCNANLDRDVIIEEDVWIGANVTILKGVTIGRGCTIAAGAVVSKSTPPYCVVGGVPARPIKFKWTIDEILQHEAILYPEGERLTPSQLDEIFRNTKIKS